MESRFVRFIILSSAIGLLCAGTVLHGAFLQKELPTVAPTIHSPAVASTPKLEPTKTAPTVVPTAMPTPVPTAESPTETPTKMIFSAVALAVSTAVPTTTPTAIPMSTMPPYTASPTPSPTATNVVGAVLPILPPLISRENESGLHSYTTISAEKDVEYIFEGRTIQAEHWKLTFQFPDTCLTSVYDGTGRLERTEFSTGLETTIIAGEFRQKVKVKKPRGYRELVHFLNFNIDSKKIKNYRVVEPNVAFPNRVEMPLLATTIRESLTSITIDADVTNSLSNWGPQ
jgi:hypothetical protein